MNITVFGALGILFVGLKLAHVITWSWLWVTCPFWGGFAIALAIVLLPILFYLIAAGVIAIMNKLNPPSKPITVFGR